MSNRRRTLKASFNAKSADGRVFKVNVYDIHDLHPMGTAWIDMGEECMLSNGTPVNRFEKGRYEALFPTGNVELTSDDPNAL